MPSVLFSGCAHLSSPIYTSLCLHFYLRAFTFLSLPSILNIGFWHRLSLHLVHLMLERELEFGFEEQVGIKRMPGQRIWWRGYLSTVHRPVSVTDNGIATRVEDKEFEAFLRLFARWLTQTGCLTKHLVLWSYKATRASCPSNSLLH